MSEVLFSSFSCSSTPWKNSERVPGKVSFSFQTIFSIMGSLLKDFVDLAEGKLAINKFCCGVNQW